MTEDRDSRRGSSLPPPSKLGVSAALIAPAAVVVLLGILGFLLINSVLNSRAPKRPKLSAPEVVLVTSANEKPPESPRPRRRARVEPARLPQPRAEPEPSPEPEDPEEPTADSADEEESPQPQSVETASAAAERERHLAELTEVRRRALDGAHREALAKERLRAEEADRLAEELGEGGSGPE